ncbi:hypothetical protein ACPOL_4918 [Acidisarcina polymorpha]|uniref:Uncharacterized protein n=1 Tax=Acidisarcina polymorpha TaxID=2211140 RepID=A0A2Z5G5C2_9BACT|nr:hypothetical protein ACPOL_4918 [Acidisarcina polymorpha]
MSYHVNLPLSEARFAIFLASQRLTWFAQQASELCFLR